MLIEIQVYHFLIMWRMTEHYTAAEVGSQAGRVWEVT